MVNHYYIQALTNYHNFSFLGGKPTLFVVYTFVVRKNEAQKLNIVSRQGCYVVILTVIFDCITLRGWLTNLP